MPCSILKLRINEQMQILKVRKILKLRKRKKNSVKGPVRKMVELFSEPGFFVWMIVQNIQMQRDKNIDL